MKTTLNKAINWNAISEVQLLDRHAGVFTFVSNETKYVLKLAPNDSENIKGLSGRTGPYNEKAAAQFATALGLQSVAVAEALTKRIQTTFAQYPPVGNDAGSLLQQIDFILNKKNKSTILVMEFAPGKDLAEAAEYIERMNHSGKMRMYFELGRVMLFDLIIGNRDRHGNNIKITEDGQIYLFDQQIIKRGANDERKINYKNHIATTLQNKKYYIENRITVLFGKKKSLFEHDYKRYIYDGFDHLSIELCFLYAWKEKYLGAILEDYDNDYPGVLKAIEAVVDHTANKNILDFRNVNFDHINGKNSPWGGFA